MQQFEAAAGPCSATITYRLRDNARPIYAAYCSCGWFADPRTSRRRALRDARQHTDLVDEHLHGLEDKRLPVALRQVEDYSTGEVFLR